MRLSKEKILEQINRHSSITSRELMDQFSVSRNYVNRLLQELRREGRLVLIGKTNRTRYVLAENRKALEQAKALIRSISLSLTNRSLDEDVVFRRLENETGIFIGMNESVTRIVHFAFTEMLNNAIDHSQSKKIQVTCERTKTAVTFVVRDFGIGIFRNVQKKFRLNGTMAAIQEILKGKTTTDAKAHSGQGVFFTSKVADVFLVDSYEKRLSINNLLPDIFISDRKKLKGTRVSFSIQLKSTRTLKAVFDAYSGSVEDSYEFNKTNITVKLYQYGSNLLSRSEAKRIMTNLEHFAEVRLDFTDIKTVGQSFADEIFRVWQVRHPHIRIIPVQANENIVFMIERAHS